MLNYNTKDIIKSETQSQDRIFTNRIEAAYNNKELFTSPNMFSPPSERMHHVLRLELTQGCDYGRCTFCDGYKTTRYKEKSYREFAEHYLRVEKFLGSHKENINRLFVGGGNALSVKQKKLENIISFLRKRIMSRRLSIYGRIPTIKEKGIFGLKNLKRAGLDLIYCGIESGSDKVLKYVNKGVNTVEMYAAASHVNKVPINFSIMIMPGLGGIKHYDLHVKDTTHFINNTHAKFITLLCVNPGTNSAYQKIMEKEMREGTNRPLTEIELVQQTRDILGGILPQNQKIGMFDSTVDQVSINPINFNIFFNRSGKEKVLCSCDKYLNQAKACHKLLQEIKNNTDHHNKKLA